ncbi:O-antigen polysaccharide polymerase Wzy [Acinetobacter ursingii]
MKFLDSVSWKNDILKRNYLISLVCFLIFLIFFSSCYLLDVEFQLDDYSWSVVFFLYIVFVYLFRYINKVNLVEIYSLFYFTTLLFMGGRFFAILLGYQTNPLFELDFFTYRLLNDQEKSILMYMLFLGLISLEIGYYTSKFFLNSLPIDKNIKKIRTNILIYFLIIIVAFYVFYTTYTNINTVLKGGYLSLFVDSQNSEYKYSFLNNIQTLLYVLLGVVCLQENKKITKTYLLLLSLYFLGIIFTGSRGSFVCFILFLVWYFNDFGTKKVNAFKISIFFALIFLALNTLYYMFTLREMSGDVNANLGLYQKSLQFLYDQGVSLFVFNESMHVTGYPIHQYFQNFFPGSTFIASVLNGSISPENKSFVTYLNSQLNPQLFELGFGLGWAFFADAYQYSFGVIYFYCFFIAFFSFFINWLQLHMYRSRIIMVISSSILIHILFLPRGTLNTVFPLILYILVFYFIIVPKSKMKR